MRLAAFRRTAGLLLAALATAALAACASQRTADSLFGVITPYRIEVVQGNVVTREMAAAVKPGMSRAQVRDALGSPLLTDIFHADRWDYVFTIRRQGAPYQQRRVTVLFDGELMKSIESDELPSEREFVVSIDTARTKSGKAPKLSLDDEQLRALPSPKAAPARSAAASEAGEGAVGPARTYPPLEAASGAPQ
ncbi:MAG TPA: outer membrane protein assembly factor BamE [Methylibium sp.]|uniref:outer membrane protein assembly factor BamE n=1 Tax=Methylibium sp. TaxID=2067992 RepID=UPI002DB5E365|nr:outer membrane protein assembly factor BamE [Methylibium sp.]HEU4460413.1 outer membrane protein assembly factor BamE [Methylibium sp.]